MANYPLNYWGRASSERLATCQPALIRVANGVLARRDCAVLCGVRSRAAQEAAFATGASKVHWPDSKHNLKSDQGLKDYW